ASRASGAEAAAVAAGVAAGVPVAAEADEKKSVPKGVWSKCDKCDHVMLASDLGENLHVCPKCQHHMAMPTAARLEMVVDPCTLIEHDENIESVDPLGFRDSKKYADRLTTTKKKTRQRDAYREGVG